jgi:hypothetical protein
MLLVVLILAFGVQFVSAGSAEEDDDDEGMTSWEDYVQKKEKPPCPETECAGSAQKKPEL